MRKFWGWVLFLIAWVDATLVLYNLAIAPWKEDVRGDWIVLVYLLVLGFCLFGWYRLVIHKKSDKIHDKENH
jgi:hypothetical protein